MSKLSNYALKYWLWPYKAGFNYDLAHPQQRQERLLTQITNRLAGTKYGLLFNASSRDNYADFAKKVPIVSYEKLKHWIDRQKAHESNILVNEPVTRYAFIREHALMPYTKSLDQSFYRQFAVQTAFADPKVLDGNAAWQHYKSHWTSTPSEPPVSLWAEGQPTHQEAPLMVKIPGHEYFLPMLSEVFFEFSDADKKIFRVHELEPGKIYDLIISQKSGLYRYQLGMRVQAHDFLKKTPSLQVIHDSHSHFRQAL